MRAKTSILAMVVACLLACTSEDDHDHGDHSHELSDAGPIASTDGSLDVASSDATANTVITGAAETYCECLLVRCHDPFHLRYGEDDADAIGGCEVDASALPVAGVEQTSGGSIECRQFHCENATDDATCEDALGSACLP